MNEIVNKFLFARDKFMREFHLKQPGFTCMLVDHLKKQRKNTKTKKIGDKDIFIKTN